MKYESASSPPLNSARNLHSQLSSNTNIMSKQLGSSSPSINTSSASQNSLLSSSGVHNLQHTYGSAVPPPLQSIHSSNSSDVASDLGAPTSNHNQRLPSGDLSGANDPSVGYPPSPTVTPGHTNSSSLDPTSSSPYHIGQNSNNANFWTPLNGSGINSSGNSYTSNPPLVKGASVSPPASSPIHHQSLGSSGLGGGALNGSSAVGSHYGSSLSHAGTAYNSAAMAAYRSASDPYASYHAAYDLSYFGNSTTAAAQALNQQYASHMNAASAAASSNMFRGIDYGAHPAEHAYSPERYQLNQL